MIGLGAPSEPKQTKPEIEFDKFRELEERVSKLERESVWVKLAVAFLGLFMLHKTFDKPK
jgi:hypothetical protein